jgi:hypothetical protein
MTDAEFYSLRPGDLVRHVTDWKAYRVTRNDAGRITAVREVDLGNPREWDLVLKASHRASGVPGAAGGAARKAPADGDP